MISKGYKCSTLLMFSVEFLFFEVMLSKSTLSLRSVRCPLFFPTLLLFYILHQFSFFFLNFQSLSFLITLNMLIYLFANEIGILSFSYPQVTILILPTHHSHNFLAASSCYCREHFSSEHQEPSRTQLPSSGDFL